MINFTFQTESDYNKAYFSGYINRYQMARIKLYHSTESTGYYDYPVHSKEELDRSVDKFTNQGRKFEVYQSEHYHDILEFAEVED